MNEKIKHETRFMNDLLNVIRIAYHQADEEGKELIAEKILEVFGEGYTEKDLFY